MCLQCAILPRFQKSAWKLNCWPTRKVSSSFAFVPLTTTQSPRNAWTSTFYQSRKATWPAIHYDFTRRLPEISDWRWPFHLIWFASDVSSNGVIIQVSCSLKYISLRTKGIRFHPAGCAIDLVYKTRSQSQLISGYQHRYILAPDHTCYCSHIWASETILIPEWVP